MNYIALLDHDHLDNNLFMKAFANAASQQRNVRGIIIHGDSPYTDRLIQTGMMREDARLRSTKELNRRIVTLLADYGISAIGIDPFHKNIISWDPQTDQIQIDESFFSGLPKQTFLVLSNLAIHSDSQTPYSVPLAKLADQLSDKLNQDEFFIFSANKSDEVIIEQGAEDTIMDWNELDNEYKKTYLPEEVHDFPCSFRLISTQTFSHLPDIHKSVKVTYKETIS